MQTLHNWNLLVFKFLNIFYHDFLNQNLFYKQASVSSSICRFKLYVSYQLKKTMIFFYICLVSILEEGEGVFV